jgi:RNA polymerase sigma-70 factor (ECF subfamily)
LLEELLWPNEDDDDCEVERKLARSLRGMVEQLPEEYRQALVLTAYDGLTQQAVADKRGLSLSGAKSRVQRGREKLRDLPLDCCHLEFDRLGRVIDYYPRVECCAHCDDSR